MAIRIEVSEGFVVPRFYGIAYRDMCNGISICYPIPLNLLVRFGKSVCYALKIPGPSLWEKALLKVYQRGYLDGQAAIMSDIAMGRLEAKVAAEKAASSVVEQGEYIPPASP